MNFDEVKLQNRCDQNGVCFVCVCVCGWERSYSLAISHIREQHNRQQNNNDKYTPA